VIEFTHPWVFLLLPIPVLARYLLPPHREPRPAVRVPFMATLRRVTGQGGEAGTPVLRRTRVQWIQLLLMWLAVIAALARPQWLDEPLARDVPMRDLLVALDLSGSMDTRDFTDAAGTVTDRLTAARLVLDDFLSRREGDRVGLIFFGSAAFVQAPFTEDLEVVRELLGEAHVRMLGPRTVLGDAIGVSIRLFERSEVEQRVLITLSDGNDTGSLVPPVRAAEIAADNGVTVYTVAMGDPAAAGEQALDEETLQAVAARTGGDYYHAADRDELEQIYARLDALNPRQVETQNFRPRRELYFWPLGFAVLLNVVLIGAAQLRFYRFRRSMAS
jgi:Ca-activated chloride channel family protein